MGDNLNNPTYNDTIKYMLIESLTNYKFCSELNTKDKNLESDKQKFLCRYKFTREIRLLLDDINKNNISFNEDEKNEIHKIKITCLENIKFYKICL